jgi:hypothetical protein
MTNPGREQSLRTAITVSSGSGTATLAPFWTLTRWVRIIPPSEAATYNIDIKDAEGHYMVLRTAQVGTMSEQLELSLGIAATVNITSSTADGTFVVKFDCH